MLNLSVHCGNEGKEKREGRRRETHFRWNHFSLTDGMFTVATNWQEEEGGGDFEGGELNLLRL